MKNYEGGRGVTQKYNEYLCGARRSTGTVNAKQEYSLLRPALQSMSFTSAQCYSTSHLSGERITQYVDEMIVSIAMDH
jgi:hypothetical protein